MSISEEAFNIRVPTVEHPAQHQSRVLHRCKAGQFVQRLNNLELLIFRNLRRGSYPTGGALADGRFTLTDQEFATYTVGAHR